MKSKATKINIDPQLFENLKKPETFIDHINILRQEDTEGNSDLENDIGKNSGMFLVQSANLWVEEAKNTPIPKMLFDEFWFEGELCILFADTNLGKSILAVQISDSITKGIQIPGFKMEAPKQKVIYFDFELSPKQFEARYSIDFKDHYVFDDNLLRAEINPDAEMPQGYKSFDEYLLDEMERMMLKTQAKILIVDNLTYLKSETEKAKDALPLMKSLKSFKKKYGLSILALAHTPKRDASRPLTSNDLVGSKMLMNLTDSAFAIGANINDAQLRYIKQIKVRYTSLNYDSQNICNCEVCKQTNFVMFEFRNLGLESDNLNSTSEDDLDVMVKQVNILHNQGKSLRDIGIELGVSHMKIKRILDRPSVKKPYKPFS